MQHYTSDQVQFRQSFRRFLAEHIAPNMGAWRDAGVVDRSAFRKAGEQGFLLIWADEAYGGVGDPDFRFEQVIIEEIGRQGCYEFYATLHSRLVGPYLNHFGNDEQRQRFLPRCVSGETVLAIAMTEPGAGTDLAGMRSVAEDRGDHFLLNGSKTYISNGMNADVIIVAAKLAGAESKHSMVLLIVERGMEGFERGRKLKKMGLHAQDTAELFFKDVKIPKANVLGEAGSGFYYLMKGLAEERLIMAVGAATNARRGFDITREFVKQRQLFGKPLADQQNTQFRMAELDAEIDMLQVYINHLVIEHNAGRLTPVMGAKAKMLASEIEWRMLDLGVQLHGGAGFMDEYPISRMFADARVNRIFAGSSETMRMIIGRDIFSQNYRSPLD